MKSFIASVRKWLTYGAYVAAIMTIVEFACTTFEAINVSPDKPKE